MTVAPMESASTLTALTSASAQTGTTSTPTDTLASTKTSVPHWLIPVARASVQTPKAATPVSVTMVSFKVRTESAQVSFKFRF